MSIRNYPDIPRVYCDMDGVLCDLETKCRDELGIHPRQAKSIPGVYRHIPVIPGAINGINQLLEFGYFIMCLTKIPSENPSAATDKILWLHDHFPILEDHIIITPDKGCVGTERDFLIDDYPEWANAHNFPGVIIPFGRDSQYKNWDDIVAFFAEV